MPSTRKNVVLGLLLVAAFLFWRGCNSGAPASTNAIPDTRYAPVEHVNPKEAVISALHLDFTLFKDEVILTANFKIDNPTIHDLKDFEIECKHYAPSGTEIDSNTRTIYEVVKARSKRTFKNFDMGFIHSQAKSSRCAIENVTLLN